MGPIRCAIAVCAAALVAGCASGPMGARPEIDDTGLPPSVTGDRDRIVITFYARDMDLTDASVQIDFSIDDGLSWSSATLVPGTSSPGVVRGNVVDDLPLADDWSVCRVDWDSFADDVGLGGDTPVRLRLTPSDLDGTGEPVYLPSPAGSINVNNRYAELDVDDSPIDFGLRVARAPETPAQDVILTITNGTGAPPSSTTLYWEVSADQGWLLVNGVDTTVAGVTPGAAPYQSTITLSADVDGDVSGAPLTASPTPYVATLTIVGKDTDAAGAPAHGTPILVTVSVTVKDAEAELFLHDGGGSNPPALAEFVCVEGDTTATPASQNFSVQNIGDEGSLLNWAALDDLTAPDWLPGFEAGTNQGQLAWDAAAAAVTVTADPTGMPAGRYSATITVWGTEDYTGADAIASPGTVDVSLWVKTKARVGLSTNSNPFSYGVDGAAYTAETFGLVLTNLGEQDLDWSVSVAGMPSWITGVAPSSGTGLAYLDTVTVQITVDPSASPPLSAQVADYTYTLTFQADNSTTPSQTFEARVHVYNPPTINAGPFTMNFSGVLLGPPSSRTLTVWSTGGVNVAPLNWTTPISYTSGAGWLSVSPASGSTTGTSLATVRADPSAVAGSGVYAAMISVTDPAAIGSPVNIAVTLTVSDINHLVINEIDAGGPDKLEIHNPTASPIVMTGWWIDTWETTYQTIYTFPVGFVLPAGGYVVVSESSGIDSATYLYIGINIWWENWSGSCELIDNSWNTVDFVQWGSTDRSQPASVWTGYIPTAASGTQTLARDRWSTDTNDASDWENTSGVDANFPTLGWENFN